MLRVLTTTKDIVRLFLAPQSRTKGRGSTPTNLMILFGVPYSVLERDNYQDKPNEIQIELINPPYPTIPLHML